MAQTEIGQQILKLREDVQRAHQLRAQAEGSLAVVQDQLTKTDAKLKELGLDPENCEAQLVEMQTELSRQMEALMASLRDEIAAYETIIKQAKAALA
jgi:chromosome segregation ATPase